MTKITGIEITTHRLPLDPPFNASWDTQPRKHFDACIVRVHTDDGVTGIGSGDFMVGFQGHEHLFIGQDPLAIEGIIASWRISSFIMVVAGRLISRSGILPENSQSNRCGNSLAGFQTKCALTHPRARCAHQMNWRMQQSVISQKVSKR